ncbi:MAG: HD domain-containing protein [Candidatus Paceibacterota bacterium]
MNIDSIFKFVTLINKFRDVERLIYATGLDRNENDAEHSYQLAMTAWYILSEGKYTLNKDLIIKYALVHDFVEVYAGDTWFYRSESDNIEKKEREKQSAIRLNKEFPEFPDFHETIEDYENQIDNEGRFVYALDKLLPIINVYLDKGRNWKKHKVTLQMLIDGKTTKIAVSPEIEAYYKELLLILEEHKDMFHVEQD